MKSFTHRGEKPVIYMHQYNYFMSLNMEEMYDLFHNEEEEEEEEEVEREEEDEEFEEEEENMVSPSAS